MAFHPKSHLIAIVGGKGGVGKSVVAANLAVTITKDLHKKCLLVDADALSCGDQNVILGVRPQKILSELAKFTGQINAQTIPSLLTRHSSGISYVGAVRFPEETLKVDQGLIERPLNALSHLFPYMVVDLGSTMTSLQQEILQMASIILVVTSPEMLAVNQTSRLISDFTTASIPGDLIYVVVNKISSTGFLPPQSIQKILKTPIIGTLIQDDKLAFTALQRGIPFVSLQPTANITASYHDIVRRITGGGLLDKLKNIAKPKSISLDTRAVKADVAVKGAASSDVMQGKSHKPISRRNLLKLSIHRELIQAMDLRKGEADTKGDAEKEKALRNKTQGMISKIIDKEHKNISRSERNVLIKEVLDEALGLGALEELLANEGVSEIMVNGHDQIFVENKGKLSLSKVTFTSNFYLKKIIERIVTPLGRRIDETSPYVDARLKDGSRVNAVIEPIAIDGPSITIRKFAKKPFTIKNYLEYKSVTEPMINFLKICVENGMNVLISGGTGSGKTTLLNCLSGFIPATERIVTIEDAAELQLKQEHVVRLETRPPNLEGTGAVTIRDLVKNSLRMRPDRIIVGECRGGEALDMLQAMNTGHDGSMTTVHANNPTEAIGRVETLCLMAGMDLPAAAIRKQIASAVHLIVQISRLSDGSRKVKSITEVVGMSGENVTLTEIFRFKEESFDKNRKIIGIFQPLGRIPTFIEEFEKRGIKIPRTLFTGGSDQKRPTTNKKAS